MTKLQRLLVYLLSWGVVGGYGSGNPNTLPPAYAQLSQASAYQSIADSLTRLDWAVCSQSWSQAIEITSELIATSTVSSASRQELLQFRQQLQHWRSQSTALTTQASCDRTRPLFLPLAPPTEPEPPPLNWSRGLAALDNSRPIIELDTDYDPLDDLIPTELTVESPEALIDTAIPIDTADGFNVVGGQIQRSPQIHSFLARRGDQISLDAEVTRAVLSEAFEILLFDRTGQLLAQSVPSDFQTSISNYRISQTDVYFAAVVPQATIPVLDQQNQVVAWQPAGNSRSHYTLMLTGVTPYRALLPQR